MISITGSLPKIDIPKTTSEVHKEMATFVINVLSTWVTQTTNPVPVWSGAARASFLKLADQAKTNIIISPVASSRIPLGIETSEGEVIADPGKQYGWLWSSDLAHIGIVDDRVDFTQAGLRAIENATPNLPDIVIQ